MGRRGENIRKRKDGRWEARILWGRDAKGRAKYRSVYGKTYLETKEKRNRLLGDSSALLQERLEQEKRTEKITFEQVMREWLSSRKDSVKASTFAHYANLLEKHILPELGTYEFSLLTGEILDQYLKEKLRKGRLDGKGGLSPKTVADIRSVLLLGIEYARKQQYPCNINTKIFYPRCRQKEIQVLGREEQEKLEQVLFKEQDPIALGVLIALYGGLRIGEICALQWGDIHFEKGTIQVSKTLIRVRNLGEEKEKKTRILIEQPKTESSNRTVPLPTFLLKFLGRWKQAKDRYILTGTKYYLEPRMCLEKYKRLLARAGLPSYTFHTLRHTFATRCVESGFDPKSLSEILGHANINTTLQRYVHPSIELKKAQMERLEKISVLGQDLGQPEEKKLDSPVVFEPNTQSVLL